MRNRMSMAFKHKIVAAGLAVLFASQTAAVAQVPIPLIEKANNRFSFVVDGKPFIIMGAQAHNSSAWPAILPNVWRATDRLGVNTVELPIYWEQIEPRPNDFDFSIVDTLIAQARQHHVRLVLLWFGTWKNGSAHYRPGWIKSARERYPDVLDRNGRPVDSPSPHSVAALKADIRAFTAVMAHLKEVDEARTVIMIQVENEPGSWGSVRDFSPAAETLFKKPVPEPLLRAVGRSNEQGKNWSSVFGQDADEIFHAWSIGRYIDQVAAAGKAVYPLPMYVNVALKDPFQTGQTPGYEFGGATFNVIPIWKAAAPAIDLIAPDIYQRDTERYLAALDQYNRADNPLFVPETIASAPYARFFYAVLARGGIGFAPFGVDRDRELGDRSGEQPARDDSLQELATSYRAITPMMRELAQWERDGNLHAVIEAEGKPEAEVDLGSCKARVRFGVGYRGEANGNEIPVGRVLIAQLGPDEFVITGNYANIRFEPSGKQSGTAWQFLKVEEGQYENGRFEPVRIWNGDETDWGLTLGSTATTLRVRVSLR